MHIFCLVFVIVDIEDSFQSGLLSDAMDQAASQFCFECNTEPNKEQKTVFTSALLPHPPNLTQFLLGKKRFVCIVFPFLELWSAFHKQLFTHPFETVARKTHQDNLNQCVPITTCPVSTTRFPQNQSVCIQFDFKLH